MDSKNLLTVNDVAKKIKVTTQYIRSLIREGHLKASMFGSQWLIHNNDLNQYIKDNDVVIEPDDHKRIAKDIPDIVPPLAILASVANGTTRIYNAQRLRIKESDRIKSVVEMVNNLGGEAYETDDGMVIVGKPYLSGGTVSSYNDHRIAMAAAIASTVCNGEVRIKNAEAVSKSYPDFWKDFERLSL